MRFPLSKTLNLVALLAVTASAQATEPAATDGRAASLAAGIPWPTVIAHRGASRDAPESTTAAYLLARDLGVDYLEADLQRTRDGVLIALHDTTLERTTNVREVFPERAGEPVSHFTLAELKRLDAGSWFNAAYPERARPGFAGLRILSLDELIDIAEGGFNKPGLYLETKMPALFPGIEEDLRAVLQRRGWLKARAPAAPGAVDVASGKGRVVLQTFSKTSLERLRQNLPEVPKLLLLEVEDGYMAAREPAIAKASSMTTAVTREVRPKAEFAAWMDWLRNNGAQGSGPGVEDGMDLAQSWMNGLAHARGLFVHAYTMDSAQEFEMFSARGVDGFFTNRPDRLLSFYGRPSRLDVAQLLSQHGY